MARHWWEDGSRLDLVHDVEASAARIREFSDAREAAGYRRFVRYASRIYASAHRMFIISPSPSIKAMAHNSRQYGWRSFFHLDTLRRMTSAIKHFFHDPRLIQLFSRYATYYGSSPFQAPATLNLIAAVEQQGVWLPQEGMAGLARVLNEIAITLGVQVSCQMAVKEIAIQHGRVIGVVTADDHFEAAEVVVYNGEVAALTAGLCGEAASQAVRPRHHLRRSLSALTLTTVAQVEPGQLSSHNVFFSDAPYRREFRDIFRCHTLPQQPTVYLRAQDQDAANGQQQAWQRLFMIINAPPLGDQAPLPDETIASCVEKVCALLRRCGLQSTIAPGQFHIETPQSFDALFAGSGGALYGARTDSMWAPLRRAGARTAIAGLYLAGGSVHPGAGVPMAAISGRQAASSVLADHGCAPLAPFADSLGVAE
jgi:1-hydroxycarotenoid 3,4-desaturase